jgi:pyridoxal phosphate enzyme (YggS family)
MDLFWGIKSSGYGVHALNAHPVASRCQAIINSGRLFEVVDVGFLEIMAPGCVITGRFQTNQMVSHGRGNTQVDNQIFRRQTVDVVFDMFQPGEKFLAPLGGDARGLVREIRSSVAVGEYGLARRQGGVKLALGLVPVSRIQQCGEVGVHGVERTELSIEVAGDELAEGRCVARKAHTNNRNSAGFEPVRKQVELRALSGAVNAFQDDQFSAQGHRSSASLACVKEACKKVRGSARVAGARARIGAMSGGLPSLTENLARVCEGIDRAASRVGRRREDITLVAVSKMHPVERIREAYDAGIRHFGENRVQEWEAKAPSLADLVATWHFIGHLQSNKAARAARLFHTVDSVDSLALAEKLDRAAQEVAGRGRLRVLIEVKLDPDPAKSGASQDEVPRLAEAVLQLPHLDLRGLMGMPPFFEDPEAARPFFRRLRAMRDALRVRFGGEALPVLSMGMSNDFEVAIEEGATEIRVGTALFGEREGA